jgi:(p)ppGpp synthase/HD superfamily hydrolase
MSVLEEAIRLAVSAHAGQTDKANRPYILHPLQVMFAVERAYNQNPMPGYLTGVLVYTLEEMMIAGVLHDVSEDVPAYSLSYMLAVFGAKIHEILDGVTRRKTETYKEFILRACQNGGSRLIKLEDVNINLGRIHLLPVTEQSIKRRYEDAKRVLTTEFSLGESFKPLRASVR